MAGVAGPVWFGVSMFELFGARGAKGSLVIRTVNRCPERAASYPASASHACCGQSSQGTNHCFVRRESVKVISEPGLMGSCSTTLYRLHVYSVIRFL